MKKRSGRIFDVPGLAAKPIIDIMAAVGVWVCGIHQIIHQILTEFYTKPVVENKLLIKRG